jgi:hypothetical protein
VALHRDGLLVEVFSDGDLDDSRYGFQIAVSRATPSPVLPMTTTGLIVGALVGWLLAAWTFRRACVVEEQPAGGHRVRRWWGRWRSCPPPR